MALYSEKTIANKCFKEVRSQIFFQKRNVKRINHDNAPPFRNQRTKNTSAGMCHKEKNEEQTKWEVTRFETVFCALKNEEDFLMRLHTRSLNVVFEKEKEKMIHTTVLLNKRNGYNQGNYTTETFKNM